MSRILFPIIFMVLSFSCAPANKYQDQFWVISDSLKIHKRPDITTQALKELKFGDGVFCREKNPSYAVPKGWIEAKSGDIRGFVEKRGIATEEMYKAIQELTDEAKDAPAEARGLTGKKAPLRLKPEKEAFVISVLKTPVKADILERIVVSTGANEKAKRQVWYKIRLGSGRAGFMPAGNMQLVTPEEIDVYTRVRKAVSWYKLNEKEDPETGNKGSDYLVTYASVDSDIGTDFTRFELYIYEPKSRQYSTALARSGLYGKLPVKIIDAGDGGKIIEIREYPKGNKNKIHVMQYSFPSPIKIVKEYAEDTDAKM